MRLKRSSKPSGVMLRPCGDEAVAPFGQGSRIVEPEDALRDERHACRLAEAAHDRGRRQHAAWENVAADEVDLLGIGLEELVADGDHLHAGRAAGLEPVAQLAEIGRPIFLADGLEHLDRGDAVIDAALVAIVLQLDVDAVREARLEDALACEGVLLLRDGEPVTRAPIWPATCSAKPPQPQPISSTWSSGPIRVRSHRAWYLRGLRRGQVLLVRLEQGRGIGHRSVEPLRIEGIAEVVMGVDVAARAGFGVAVHPMPEILPKSRQRGMGQHALDRIMVGRKDLQKLRDVRAVPFAADIGFRKADIAAADEAPSEGEGSHHQRALRPGLGSAEPQIASVGEYDSEDAALEPQRIAERLAGDDRQAAQGLLRILHSYLDGPVSDHRIVPQRSGMPCLASSVVASPKLAATGGAGLG